MIKPAGFIRRLPSAKSPAASVYRVAPDQHLTLRVVYGICEIPPGHYLDVAFGCCPRVLQMFTEVQGALSAGVIRDKDLAEHLETRKGPGWKCQNGRLGTIDLRGENVDAPLHIVVINGSEDQTATAYYRLGTGYENEH